MTDQGDSEDMDMISKLPDQLPIKVLSLLPTQDAVSTSILSKRWEFLWMWLPKLEYDYSYYSVSRRHMLRRFINLNLPLHRSRVIESLRLKFCNEPSGSIKPLDINLWVIEALFRCVSELSLNLSSLAEYDIILPSSLYICKSIVILELADQILLDVPRVACLPSLKTLLLRSVTYSNRYSLHRLLSKCPVLKDLVVERYRIDNLRILSVSVKSLLRLTLRMGNPCPLDGIDIRTPSLKYLSIVDYRDDIDNDNDTTIAQDTYNFKNMPKLEEASLNFTYQDIRNFVSSIISVKRLQLCLRVITWRLLDHIDFNQLEHVKLCSCDSNWSLLLAWLLRDSPNLRDLEIFMDDKHEHNVPVYWEEYIFHNPPFSSEDTLQTFKWIGMHGTEKEMKVAKYILKNGHSLETVTILFHSSLAPEIKDKLSKDLSLSFEGPTTCQLILE